MDFELINGHRMQKSGSICVVPQSIEFNDVKPGSSSSKDFWVHNIGKKPIRIRFSMPNNPHFAFIGNTSVMTAPGLEIKGTIRYFAPTNSTTPSCIFKIMSPDGSIDLPLLTASQKPEVRFDTDKIDFGIISPNYSVSQIVTIGNYGNKECNLVLSCAEGKVQIDPKNVTLQPDQEKEVTISFSPIVRGDYNFNIEGKSKDGKLIITPIQVVSKVVEHELVLLFEDKEVSELNFGYIYYGQRRVLQATIKNKCANSRSFAIMPPHDPKNKMSTSRAPSTINDPDIVFTAVPCEGTLRPFSSTVISFIFGPPLTNNSSSYINDFSTLNNPNNASNVSDTEQMYNHLSTMKTNETQQTFEFQLTGVGVMPNFKMNSVDFLFGRQAVRTKTSQQLIIENRSQFLPITFDIKEVAQFKFTPNTGTIKPNSKREISVTFFPKNMGDFEISTLVVISKGLSKRRINLSGTSVAKDVEPKKFQRKPIYETDEVAKYNAHHPSNEYGMTIDDIRRKKKLRDEFDGYLTNSAAKREKIERKKNTIKHATKDAENMKSTGKITDAYFQQYIESQIRRQTEDGEDPINLGMEHCAGMKPPDPPLLKGKDLFYVPDPKKMGLIFSTQAGANSTLRNIENFNDKLMIQMKFKSKPTTPPETEECTRVLTPIQQTKILASHQTINFGTVSVYASEKRSFEITNSLDQHIIVAMKYDSEELNRSTPSSQVIPPHQTAGFDITLLSTKPQNLLRTITYLINNNHTYSVNVIAQVVSIDLHMSRNIIDFKFPDYSTETQVSETVTLQNKSNALVNYKWSNFNAVFSINSESGTIPPHGTINLTVNYNPGIEPYSETTAILNVVGGSQKHLRLRGDMGKPKISVDKKQVSFGTIPIDTVKEMRLKLRNFGSDPAIFSVMNPSEDMLKITPSKGRINGEELTELYLSIVCRESMCFQTKVTIFVCGASPISFIVSAIAEVPMIEFEHPGLDFGKLYVGTTSSKPISISNVSSIPATMILDLSSNPFFHLEFPAQLGMNEPDEETNSILIIPPSYDYNDTSFSSRTQTEIISGSNSMASIESNIENIQSYTYRITILPHNTVDVGLVFQPQRIGKYKFQLPLTLLNVPNDPSMNFGIKDLVKGESIHAPILPSVSVIDFGIGAIIEKDNPNACSISRQLHLKNESKLPVIFRFDTKTGENSNAFSVKPEKGRIDYCSTASVIINFSPKKAAPYNHFLPLYVVDDSNEGESLISNIQLTGVGSSRRFKTSTNQICLPTVPLGVRVERTIYVINMSYCVTSLRATTPINEKAFPLVLSFPNGNKLNYTTPKIPLNISFQSNLPLSFSTTIAVIDDDGNSYSFTVSAATDNSIFTLYSFLSTYDYKVQTQGTGGPIVAALNDIDIHDDFLSAFLSTNDLFTIENLKPQTSPALSSFLVRFLNAVVLNNSKVHLFPNDFVKNGLSLVAEMISNLSDKPMTAQNFQQPSLPGMLSRNTTSMNSTEIGNAKVSRLSKMKNFVQYLKGRGAILSNIRPEFLLSKSEFVDVTRVHVIKQLLGIDYYGAPELSSFNQEALNEFTSSQSFGSALLPRLKVAEHLFSHISSESWTVVILQILKLFMFGKMTLEGFGSTNGIQEALKKLKETTKKDLFSGINRSNKNLMSSNILSTIESMLLKWVTIHYCSMNLDNMKIFIDYRDLRDPRVFLALFQSHLPISMRKTTNVSTNDNEHIMNKIVEYMEKIKINFFPTTKDIIEGNNIMIALIIGQLYSTLPHFIPTTSIDFEKIPLCQRKIQTVNISNPSKYEIVFNATIDGPKNFALLRNSIKLGPNESSEFEVEYTARQHKSESGMLVLVPNKPKMLDRDLPNEPNTTRRPTSKIIKTSTVPAVKRPNSARVASKVDAPAFVSTIVVNLTASTIVKGPYKTIRIEAPIYEPTKSKILIENVVKLPGKFKLLSRYFQISDENGNLLSANSSLNKQIQEFLDDPSAEPSFITATSKFATLVQQHQAFLFTKKDIEFKDSNSEVEIEMEFVPISLGSYRCLLLLYNENIGEFIYEIIGKTTLPHGNECNVKYKIESGQSKVSKINFDLVNKQLFFAMSYSICKVISQSTQVSDVKFKDMLNFNIRELQSQYTKTFVSIEFKVSCSSQYFSTPSPYVANSQLISLPITFSPTKPGDYQCHVIITSDYDVRVFVIHGTALMATKTLLIEMNTVCGRMVTQQLPFTNPSDTSWHYKVSINGDEGFKVSERFDVAAHSTYQFPLTFISKDKGMYNTLLTVTNYTKETTVKYNIMATVEDPPAIDRIKLKFRAKDKFHYSFPVSEFIDKGEVAVTSNVPVITFNDTIWFTENVPSPVFEFDAYSVRSGISAGIITFCDKASYRSIWYILELDIEPPLPEEVIQVSTVSRQSVTIKIPVHNPSNELVTFDVLFTEEDLFGDKEIQIEPNQTYIYNLIYSPLKSMERISFISFINDIYGEFIYELKLTAEQPGINILAPLSTPIGKFATTSILVENPLDKKVMFKVENENPNNFQVISKPMISLNEREKKHIEVRYIPSSIGKLETSELSLRSREIGEWYYRLSGIGKPPQPMTPIIIESEIHESASASVIFKNPFPFLTKFETTISTESSECFYFLNKKRVFTLANYGDEHQIAISFSPKVSAQFNADVIVRSMTLESDITWAFPIIGTAITEKTKPPQLNGQANKIIEGTFELPLVAESEKYQFNEYVINVEYPQGYEWISKILDIHAIDVKEKNNSPCLVIFTRISPKRPIERTIKVCVENPFSQKWYFPIDLNIKRGDIYSKVVVESNLKIATRSKINVNMPFNSRTAYHVYFAQGSASEFTVSPQQGYIEASLEETRELPFDIIFHPLIYGKVMKGLLVLDMLEQQILFEVSGKVPDYIPPVIKNPTIDTTLPLSARRYAESRIGQKKRNIIKDNIESARTPRAASGVRVKQVPRK
ncbi:hypothetical protein TRFO_16023 [Tritrichomonas foetus]|uniref:Calponin-homology (CH) domain-containing protein n=1 Tax=Tritrichomonas foetus TaxID=1144522 RepID=A0A1J4KVM3_9EUKA|nr:hypothetical protein TRFO_16023 [Tritrichomonas foetus]|eukprot:OHT13796.1 hypothetical protein TRFO_16023 [Tritrichomonas foetus]